MLAHREGAHYRPSAIGQVVRFAAYLMRIASHFAQTRVHPSD